MALNFDDIGLFWQTPPRISRAKAQPQSKDIAARIASYVADSSNYIQPELKEAPSGIVALDFETDDPTLFEKGSAWAFEGVGGILGAAVAWDGFEAYYPTAHREGNIDQEQLKNWLIHHAKRSDIKFVCAHAAYDMGWLRREIGLYPTGGVEDVQFMAALLDEHRLSYSLDSIATSYLGEGKETASLNDIEKKLGITHTQLMSNLKYLSGPAVATYAAGDARKTYDLHKILLPKLQEQDLIKVHELESSLIPMSTEMRRRGVRVDVDKAQRLSDDIRLNKIPALQEEIKRLCGVQVEPWESESIEKALATFGYVCKRTRTGQPNIDVHVLERLAKTQPIAAHVLSMRKMSKVQGTFLDGHILGHHVNGRVHANFNQLRAEKEEGGGKGTISGRYSSDAPNLQQLPIRDKEWGPLVRSLFLSEEGEIICSADYSSQEPRLAVHFAYEYFKLSDTRSQRHLRIRAMLRGIEEAVARYKENPRIDYHQMVADLCGIPRGEAKTINLALSYGAAGAKIAKQLGLPTEWMQIIPQGRGRSKWNKIDEEDVIRLRSEGYSCVEVAGPQAKVILQKWEQGAPFIKGLSTLCTELAKDRGYIKTILGRRCRFPLDAHGEYDYVHAALNRVCQGSAADQSKTAMKLLWDEGEIPLMPIHDEFIFSVGDEVHGKRLAEPMVNAIKLNIPTVCDVKFGKNWGEVPK